jgi:hypothetical protein
MGDFTSAGRRRQARFVLLLASMTLTGLSSAGELQHRHLFARPEQPQAMHALDARQAADAPPARLLPLQANLTQAFPVVGANADGSDLWPCLGHTAGNPDCLTVGDPTVQLPRGGVVLGFPAVIWSLASGPAAVNGVGCDAFTNGTSGTQAALYRPCAQLNTWFEDNSNDPTDDLLQRIVVTQGFRVVYDSGTVDYGPAGPIKFPVNVLLSYDVNFGFWPGASVGPNNGNCSADVGYPLTAPTNPGAVYVVAAGQTCERPVSGKVKFHTVTLLATPRYTLASGAACKGVPSPCFTVSWTTRDEIHQDFEAFFE